MGGWFAARGLGSSQRFCRSFPLVAVLGVLLAGMLLPAGASAAGCTDTWTGGPTGSWFNEANWSAGHIPTELDTACIGAGHTAEAASGYSVAAAIDGEGGLSLSGGTLILASGEASTIGHFTATGGTITGPSSLEISGSLVVGGETNWQGSGSIVVSPGATANLHPSTYLRLEGRRLVNEGKAVLDPVEGGAIMVNEATEILNTGTFTVEGAEKIGAFEEYGAGGTLVNDGTFQKTTGGGTTLVWVNFKNEGTVDTRTGSLSFGSGSSTSGSRWEASEGAENIFSKGGSFSLRGTIAGDVSVEGGYVDLEGATGTIPKLTVSSAEVFPYWYGVIVDPNASVSVEHLAIDSGGTLSMTGERTVAAFNQASGTLTGPGILKVSNSMTVRGEPKWQGSGSVVVLPKATAELLTFSAIRLEGRRMVNEGSISVNAPGGGSIVMNEAAEILNRGIFTVEFAEATAAFESYGAGGTIVNRGTFQKTVGTGTSIIEPSFKNFGPIEARSGRLDFKNLIREAGSTATPNKTCAGEPVDCGTGNFTETQTDLSIGGRGIGLNLTRTYSGQAAAAGAIGIFGRGWTNSFGATLTAEEGGIRETLTEASGATVPFARSGTSYISPDWSRDGLTGSAEAGFTLTLADQNKERFSGAGRLESVTDRNGNATKLAYNGSGMLEKITDPTGRTITLIYNGEGMVEKATDPIGHYVRYTYESGNLKTVTLPGESAPNWQFVYDGSHRITSMTNGRGGKTTNEYDGSSRVVSQTDPVGRTLTWRYESFHTTITNEATGAVTDEWFNSDNQPISITHGYGTSLASTETFAYTEAGLLASRTDGDGHTTNYGYDPEGDRTSERNAEGDETKWTFNGVHQLVSETTPRGEKTTIERNANGDPTAISRPAPGKETQTVSYGYGPYGEVEWMTDPFGNKWTYKYDSHGDRISEVDPLSDKRTWTYDGDSRLISTVSPRGNESGAEAAKFTTAIERDAQGRPIKVTGPLGGVTKYSYDADGNVESVTDPNGRTTKFTYDADNEQTKVERPSGATEETSYDGGGEVASQTNGDKQKTSYVRNALEEPIEVVDPLERKTIQTFDAAGNLKSVTDPEGRTTTYGYDHANRLNEAIYSGEPSKDVTYAYDEDGDLTKMTDATGESIFEYDQLDRLVHSRNGHAEAVAWSYNLDEEPVGLTYPNGKAITRTFDKVGRLKTVADWLGHTTTFAYNRDSMPITTTFPVTATGDVDEYAYDRADRMSGVTMKKGSTVLASLAYTRDPAGQLESLVSKGLPGPEAEAFSYDEDERLTKAGTAEFGYDGADNITKAPGTSNAFDKASELESATGIAFAYDKEGRRTKETPSSGPATTYGYDQAGNLTAVARPEEGKTPAISESFGYDGLDLLASRTTGSSTHHLVWDLSESPELLLSDGEYSYVYGPGGLPFEQISSAGAPTYLHHDQLGSTRLLTNSSGETSGAFTYTPYGGLAGHTGTASMLLGYAGQYTATQSGLQYLRARWYDPATAQFMTADPLASITRAPFLYAGDDPADLLDRTGAATEGAAIECRFPELCIPAPGPAEQVGAQESAEGIRGAIAAAIGESGAESVKGISGRIEETGSGLFHEASVLWNSILDDESSDEEAEEKVVEGSLCPEGTKTEIGDAGQEQNKARQFNDKLEQPNGSNPLGPTGGSRLVRGIALVSRLFQLYHK